MSNDNELREGPMNDQLDSSITDTRGDEGQMMEDINMYPKPNKGNKMNSQDKTMSKGDENYQMYDGDTMDSADGTVGMATVSCVTVVTLLSTVLWMIV